MSGQEQKKPSGFSQAPKSSEETNKGPQQIPNAQDALDKLEAAGKVKVIHGANDEDFELVGTKVSKVRANLVDAFNIPAGALSFVNGEQVDEDYVLQANSVLEFILAAGQKGLRSKDLRQIVT